MPDLTEEIDLPGGVDPATVTATVELWGDDGAVTGFAPSPTIGGPRKVTGNPWTVTNLVGNDDIDYPAGTVYRCLRTWPGLPKPLVDYVTIPTSGGPYELGDRLSDPPASIASPALSAHAADLTLHGSRRLWVARKTDATFQTAVTSPTPVTGWNRSDTAPAGDWMVEASAEAFGATPPGDGGTLGLWVDLPITAIARSANVVTATLAVGHGVQVGADVFVDVSDNTFDGRFLITSSPVGGTTVQWAQVAGNDADGGTGTLSVRLGVNASFRNAGTIRALAHIPDAWWAPAEGLAYTMQPRFNASVGTVTLLTGPFFGLPGQGVMTAETR